MYYTVVLRDRVVHCNVVEGVVEFSTRCNLLIFDDVCCMLYSVLNRVSDLAAWDDGRRP